MIESLEHRRLCASVHRQPAFRLDDDGTLRISGSAGNDVIYLGGNNGDVRLRLNDRKMVLTQPVRRAVIYGGAGNDLINCGSAPDYNQARFPVYLDGGTGNDTLVGGGGGDARTEGDTLRGGTGDDTLSGSWNADSQPDYLDAGPGDDALFNGAVMHGGSGDDVATIGEYAKPPVFTSGLERFVDARDSQAGAVVVPPEQYVSTLATRNGRLVLSYRPAGREAHALLAPYLRDDGRVGVTVTYDYPTPGSDTPAERMFVTLNAHYTARRCPRASC
ncbi:MAG: calcium-binding protein [Tepidisphaeraceae bacterium]